MQQSVQDRVVRRVSMRDYEGVIDDICAGYGIDKSSVSRQRRPLRRIDELLPGRRPNFQRKAGQSRAALCYSISASRGLATRSVMPLGIGNPCLLRFLTFTVTLPCRPLASRKPTRY